MNGKQRVENLVLVCLGVLAALVPTAIGRRTERANTFLAKIWPRQQARGDRVTIRTTTPHVPVVLASAFNQATMQEPAQNLVGSLGENDTLAP